MQERVLQPEFDAPRAHQPSEKAATRPGELRIYSHSTLFYWWPVWAFGYLFAAMTYFSGGTVQLDEVRQDYFYQNTTLGMVYVLILSLVILTTNVTLRGIYSVVLILALTIFGLALAYLNLWQEVFDVIPQLSVHMNMGFYIVFSTIVFIMWATVFFIFDRMTYYRISAGQLTRENSLSGGEASYDARGMLFEQHGDDFLRHRLLGLGSGDLTLTVTGAKSATIDVPNVLFAERKVKAIQRLIAVEPDGG